MLSSFIHDLNKSNLIDNTNNVEFILSSVRSKFPSLFNLKTSISFNDNGLLNLFSFLIQGWFSVFYIFLYSGIEFGKYFVKLSLVKLILSKSNLIVSEYLS